MASALAMLHAIWYAASAALSGVQAPRAADAPWSLPDLLPIFWKQILVRVRTK